MSNIEPDYNYQIATSGRGYGKTFFENRIRQAYKSGIDVGFIEKHRLIKYLEDKIQECKNTIEMLEGMQSHRISILQTQIHNYQDILERVKSGKYE